MIDPQGKPVNLMQLHQEMEAASIDVGQGLGMTDKIFRYSGGSGLVPADPTDFVDPAAAQAVLDAHVAMRQKTTEEYSAEFQDAATTPARKQEIRDIQSGLLPPEYVPV
jgi:hypothetical protein